MVMKPAHLAAILAMALIAAPVAAAAASLAQEVPPVYGIEVYEYDRSISQEAGTSAVYLVRVRNTGVLDLAGARLYAEGLPTTMFQSDSPLARPLKFGDTADMTYRLYVPAGFEGTYAFNVVAAATYGAGNTSHSKPVRLEVGSGAGKATTTTAPVQTISLDASVKQPAGAAEAVFSRFRAGVEYVRDAASSIISDRTMLLTIAAVLLAIALTLIVVQKVLHIAMRNG